MNLVKEREGLFGVPFSRIILCLPAGSLHQHEAYVNEMTGAFQALEVIEGLPSLPKLGLDSECGDHKLLV